MAAGPDINLFDIVLGGAILYGAYHGYNEGLKQPLLRAALLLALLCAFRYYTWFDTFLVDGQWVEARYGPYASGLLVFILVFLFLQVLFAGLANWMTRSPVAFSIDKLIGVFWGGFKALMIASFATMALGMVNLPPASWTNGSMLYDPMKDVGMNVINLTFSEIPLAQKIMGEFGRIFKMTGDSFAPNQNPKTQIQNPITQQPVQVDPSISLPKNSPVIVDVIPPPPSTGDRSIRNSNRETAPSTPPSTTKVVERKSPDYPRYETPEEKKVVKRKPTTSKPPTIR